MNTANLSKRQWSRILEDAQAQAQEYRDQAARATGIRARNLARGRQKCREAIARKAQEAINNFIK